MKKKILFLTLTLSIVLISCKEESLKCDSSTAKNTVKELYKEELLKAKVQLEMSGFENIEEFLDVFFNNNIKFQAIRTTEIDKELKSCGCAAQISLDIKPEVIDGLMNDIKGNQSEYRKEIMQQQLNRNIDITYNLQETTDGEILVETFIPDELGALIGTGYISYIFEKQSKEEKFIIEKDKIYTYQSGTEDCSYDLWFILSPKNDEIKGEYIQKCYFNTEPSSNKFTGVFKNGKIIANIDKKEFFELSFNNSEMEYYLKKRISDNGEIMTYDDDSPLVYTLKE